MKKRYLIIMIIQSVIIFFVFIYAFMQKLEADKNLMEAVKQEQIASENKKLIQELRFELERVKAEGNQPK